MVGMAAICRGTLRYIKIKMRKGFNSQDFIDTVLRKRPDLSTYSAIDKPIVRQLYRLNKRGVIVKTKNKYRIK